MNEFYFPCIEAINAMFYVCDNHIHALRFVCFWIGNRNNNDNTIPIMPYALYYCAQTCMHAGFFYF